MTVQFCDIAMPGPLLPLWEKLKGKYPDLQDSKYESRSRIESSIRLYDAACKLADQWQKKFDEVNKDEAPIKAQYREWLDLNNTYGSQMDAVVAKYQTRAAEIIKGGASKRLRSSYSIDAMTEFVKDRKDLIDKIVKNDEKSAKILTSLMAAYNKDKESIEGEEKEIYRLFETQVNYMRSVVSDIQKIAKKSSDRKVMRALDEFSEILDQTHIA